MPASPRVRTRRWQAIAITVVVGAMALGSAAIGWWYARESPPHQGPIILIAVDGLSGRDVSSGAGAAGGASALNALAAEGVTFTRAYTHAPLTLPTYTTLLTGRLPFEHGVRDDGGFVLRPEVRTLAELLRNRGFSTGGAVSTYLLRRETGIAQGFAYFDDTLSAAPDDTAIERAGERTAEVALKWLDSQSGQRFFLFVEVPKASADAVVSRVVASLKQRSLYDSATMLVVGGRGTTDDGARLDDAALRVAFVVKQPRGMLRGRDVHTPVQLADLAPTILDLVRAPLPGGLHGRSLRPMLDDADGAVPSRPFYAESLAGYYRLGTAPLFALTTETRRLVRDVADTIEPISSDSGASAPVAAPVPDTLPLGAVLDELVAGSTPPRPDPLNLGEESRLALTGFLAGPDPRVDAGAQAVVADSKVLAVHRRAAQLVGESKFAGAIQTLQGIVKTQPALGAVHFQIGQLLARTGRLDEAVAALTLAEQAWPDSFPIALALSDVLRRSGKLDEAKALAEAAVARAERGTPRDRVAAHDSAARVALALRDAAAATSHAAVSVEVDPTSQLPQFVKGRLLFDAGKYEEAVEAFSADAADTADEVGQTPVAELELYKGESLARLDRNEDAAVAFRSEIEAFPRDPRAYLSLATLYQSTRPEDVEEVLDDLLEAVPTPEGYGLAAAAWANAGDIGRANAIRANARVKFRGDPTLARLLGRGARR